MRQRRLDGEVLFTHRKVLSPFVHLNSTSLHILGQVNMHKFDVILMQWIIGQHKAPPVVIIDFVEYWIKVDIHYVVLFHLIRIKSMLQNALYYLGYSWTNFNIIIEKLRLGVVARFTVIEYMRKEDDFELIKVKSLGDMQKQVIRVMSWMCLSHFVQNFIGLVSQPTSNIFSL